MAVVHGLDGKEAEEEEAQWRIQGRERGGGGGKWEEMERIEEIKGQYT